MSTFRARSLCPNCSTEEEVWFHRGKIEPISTSQCTNCYLIYDPSDFITCFLEMHHNVTISSNTVATAFIS